MLSYLNSFRGLLRPVLPSGRLVTLGRLKKHQTPTTLRFLPSDICVEAFPGQTIFEVGWKKDAGIQSACVGKGTCGLCRITVVKGEESLSLYNEIEDKHLGNLYHLTKRRLSCQSIILEGAGEIVVEVIQKRVRKA